MMVLDMHLRILFTEYGYFVLIEGASELPFGLLVITLGLDIELVQNSAIFVVLDKLFILLVVFEHLLFSHEATFSQ